MKYLTNLGKTVCIYFSKTRQEDFLIWVAKTADRCNWNILCKSHRCKYKKSDRLCNLKCHNSGLCENK